MGEILGRMGWPVVLARNVRYYQLDWPARGVSSRDLIPPGWPALIMFL